MSDAPAKPILPGEGPAEPPAPPALRADGRRRRRALVLVALAALLVAGVLAVRARKPGGGAPAARAPDAQARPVSVSAAQVARRDVPIFLDGLGNVTAFKTVTVKTQVDGRLDQVLFREGQVVRQGQVLAQIDPRPFQIQLHQAEGALALDEAQLKNAELNVTRDRQP